MEMRMMIYSLIVNIAVLVIIANILSHVPAFQRSIQREHRSLREDFILSIVFFCHYCALHPDGDKNSFIQPQHPDDWDDGGRLAGRTGDRFFRIHVGRRVCFILYFSDISGPFHGVLHGVLRPSGSRILSVLSTGTLEVQGYGTAWDFCGGI